MITCSIQLDRPHLNQLLSICYEYDWEPFTYSIGSSLYFLASWVAHNLALLVVRGVCPSIPLVVAKTNMNWFVIIITLMDFSLLLVTSIYLSSNHVSLVISVLWALITSNEVWLIGDTYGSGFLGTPDGDCSINVSNHNLTPRGGPDNLPHLKHFM